MKISVVIPVYNEAQRIPSLLEAIFRADSCDDLLEDVIVVDGGSADDSVEKAKLGGAKAYSTVKSRAIQMNLGARKSKGDILHFIHADSLPPKSFLLDIIHHYQKDHLSGCFRSRFNSTSRLLLTCSYFTRFNGLFFRGGGQTLWVDKELFQDLKGYDESLELMEEYDFIKLLSRQSDFKVIPSNVLVSARDYDTYGAFRLQFMYGIVYAMYFSGMSQLRIKRFVNNRIKRN